MVNEMRKKVLQEVNLRHIIKNTKGGKKSNKIIDEDQLH